jgi:hypothetical protein
MSKTQINKLVALNKLHQFVANEEIARREKIARQRKHEAAMRRWSKVRKPIQQEIMTSLREEIRKVRGQLKHAKQNGHRDTFQFFTEYIDCLVKLRAELEIKFTRMQETPKYRVWEAFVDDSLRRVIRQNWLVMCKEMHAERVARLRPPKLTEFWFDDEAKPEVGALNPWTNTDAKSRLAQIGAPRAPIKRDAAPEPDTAPQSEPIDWDNL